MDACYGGGNVVGKLMAKFDIAYGITGHNEGGYANNPADHGGETYAGISRVFWPNWGGWAIIDKAKKISKKADDINKYAKTTGIEIFKRSFYKQNFWDVNKLDLINDQQIANNIYDFGVNSGVSKAAKILQEALGVNVDGIIGSITISKANQFDAKNLYDRYNRYRSDFYHKLAQNPDQLQFLKGWIGRIKPYVQASNNSI